MLYIASAAIGYFLGSLNFGIILSKLIYKKDIRNFGSGNAGATNALRNFSKIFALAVFFFDLFKGSAAVLLTRLFSNGDQTLYLIAGLFAVLGHSFPIFFKFKGGKGVSTTAGVMIAVEPILSPVLFGIFLIVSISTRYISLASIIGALFYPVLTYFFCGHSIERTAFAAVMAFFIIFMHRANIVRLVKGTESKVSLKGKKKDIHKK